MRLTEIEYILIIWEDPFDRNIPFADGVYGGAGGVGYGARGTGIIKFEAPKIFSLFQALRPKKHRPICFSHSNQICKRQEAKNQKLNNMKIKWKRLENTHPIQERFQLNLNTFNGVVWSGASTYP